MKKKKKLPEFKTPEEFAKFVETHDMAEYLDQMEEVKVTINREQLKQARVKRERRVKKTAAAS
jgi:hypothetical protein